MKKRARRRAGESRFVQQITKPFQDANRAEFVERLEVSAHVTREYVSENLLLGRMCLENGAISENAIGGVLMGLRVVQEAADSDRHKHVLRAISGANTPLREVIKRHRAGKAAITKLEIAAISAAISSAINVLDDLDNATLILADELDEIRRRAIGATAQAAAKTRRSSADRQRP